MEIREILLIFVPLNRKSMNMTKNEYLEKAHEVVKLIEDSKFFKTFGYKGHWLSGSSTVVYPITDWVEDREIVIQLDSTVYRGRSNSAKALIGKIEKILKIRYWGFGNYDGSCPPTLYIRFYE